jgi:4-hydroxy-tetrahydrodipicolinate synthase
MSSLRTDWKGVFVVAVTPFDGKGEVDHEAFDRLLDIHAADGVDGIIVAGSTGEWYTLHDDERLALLERARARMAPGVTLIAGTSAIATRDAVRLTAAARDLGCDGAMVLAPPYALPNQRELIAHFEALAEVGLPLMIYNNPGRTQVEIGPALTERLCAFESVVALKDSTKDLYQIAATLRAVRGRLAVFSGLEPYALAALQRGAVGIVSMGANVLGSRAVSLHRHAAAGRWAEAIPVQEDLDRLYDAFYAGGYGAYVVIKACMNLLGRPAGLPRRPHLPVDDAGRESLARLLRDLGALEPASSAAD